MVRPLGHDIPRENRRFPTPDIKDRDHNKTGLRQAKLEVSAVVERIRPVPKEQLVSWAPLISIFQGADRLVFISAEIHAHTINARMARNVNRG